MTINRRRFISLTGATLTIASSCSANPSRLGSSTGLPTHFEVHEATISDLQKAMSAGQVTALDLVECYLERIAAFDTQGPCLNAIAYINPSAKSDAAALDEERRAGRVRGPMHGIPVLVKDNFATKEMPTSVGSIAFSGFSTGTDAFQVERLKAAGAVILGKTCMDELAETVEGVSSLTGQTVNPYDPRRISGGSSGGSAVAAAASFAAVTFGSDTGGSLRIPASYNNLITLRPTWGLTSTEGIVPASHTHDTAGPIARTVTDLAISLDAIIGHHPQERGTKSPLTFVDRLHGKSLRGARIGRLTHFFYPDSHHPESGVVIDAAVSNMASFGAEIIDIKASEQITSESRLYDATVWNYEFRDDLIRFLASTHNPPVSSIEDILSRGLYGASLRDALSRYEEMGKKKGAEYRIALARQESIRQELLSIFAQARLDAIVYPTVVGIPRLVEDRQSGITNTTLSPVTGFPALCIPAGFTEDAIPIGIELLGKPGTDADLLALAFSYEQFAKARMPPFSTPPLTNRRSRAILEACFKIEAPDSIRADARIVYNPMRNHISIAMRVRSGIAEDVLATALTYRTDNKHGPIAIPISGPAELQGSVRTVLTPSQRQDLLGGRLYVTLYTKKYPYGSAYTQLVFHDADTEVAT